MGSLLACEVITGLLVVLFGNNNVISSPVRSLLFYCWSCEVIVGLLMVL